MNNCLARTRLSGRAALAAAVLFGSSAANASPIAANVLAHYLATATLATTRLVSSCADNGSAGTLRVAIASAGSGDLIDLSGLPAADPACTSSTITLTQGEIAIAHNMTLLGPSGTTLTVAAGGQNRVFNSTSTDAPGGYLQITSLTVTGGRNYADGAGGCIRASGQVRLDHATVSDCIAYTPGSNSTIKAAIGGGIYANSVSLTNGSLVSDNVVKKGPQNAYLYGAGVFAKTDVACSDSTFSRNASYGSGGGITASGSVSLSRCTLDTNSAKYGGGISMSSSSGNLSINQSTITGNSAFIAAGGIGTKSPATIRNSTVAFNQAGFDNVSGGIETGAQLTLVSSIVARNSNANGANADIGLAAGGSIGGANNLVMSGPPAAPGVIVSALDPKLAPLGSHGGLTRTHALLAGSPAIDLGNNSGAFASDQRGAGFAREVPSGEPDIGAYERQVIDDEIFGNGFD